MVVVVEDKQVDDAMQQLIALGEKPFMIGQIEAKKKKDIQSVEVDCV
jgi:phosphoribosylaminoimidazole (AIR) synthetase